MDLPSVKDLVKEGYVASFTRYFDGNLWYKVRYTIPARDAIQEFEFPVPISDIGNATFLASDKAILFMRYMRKHIELLKEAQKESP